MELQELFVQKKIEYFWANLDAQNRIYLHYLKKLKSESSPPFP